MPKKNSAGFADLASNYLQQRGIKNEDEQQCGHDAGRRPAASQQTGKDYQNCQTHAGYGDLRKLTRRCREHDKRIRT